MKYNKTKGYRIFEVFNYLFLIVMAASCIIPMINLFAVSLSSSVSVSAGEVSLWPVEFTTLSYKMVSKNQAFWQAMGVSIKRIIIGGIVNMLITIFCAYPLSKSKSIFPSRKYYVWLIFFTMLFNGGLVPTFLIVYYTGLMDSIWALVLPGAVNAWYIILMLNFFRDLPEELSEAAFIDGASHWQILWRVILPISKPVLATVGLFILVAHWNAWFDGMLYMQRPENYPLQTYLQSMLTIDVSKFLTSDQMRLLDKLSGETIRAAQVFIGAFPILCVYPFLQRYFTKGMTLGSVKG